MDSVCQVTLNVSLVVSLSVFITHILFGNGLKWILLIIVFPVSLWIPGAAPADSSSHLVLGNGMATILLVVYIAVGLIVLFLSKPQMKIIVSDHVGIPANGLYATAMAEPAHIDKIGRFLNEDRQIRFNAVINQFLLEKRPFLQQKYSLRELSSDVDIPMNYLSAFINRYHKMNYNDFINSYRVTHSKDMIMNGEWKQKTLEAIAFESGFNNRNTFTTAFRKETGVSPFEYLQAIKKTREQKLILNEIRKPLLKVG